MLSFPSFEAAGEKGSGHTQRVNSVCFSPNGNTIISASNDRYVIEWDVATGEQILCVFFYFTCFCFCFLLTF